MKAQPQRSPSPHTALPGPCCWGAPPEAGMGGISPIPPLPQIQIQAPCSSSTEFTAPSNAGADETRSRGAPTATPPPIINTSSYTNRAAPEPGPTHSPTPRTEFHPTAFSRCSSRLKRGKNIIKRKEEKKAGERNTRNVTNPLISPSIHPPPGACWVLDLKERWEFIKRKKERKKLRVGFCRSSRALFVGN